MNSTHGTAINQTPISHSEEYSTFVLYRLLLRSSSYILLFLSLSLSLVPFLFFLFPLLFPFRVSSTSPVRRRFCYRALSLSLSLSLAAPGNAYSRVFWIIKSTRRVNNVRASLVADFLVFLSCSLLPSNRRRHNATIGKRLRAPNPLFIHKSYGNSAPLSGRREQVRVYHRHLAPRVSVRITIGIQGWLSLSSKGESITAIVLWSTMRV